MSTFSLDCYQRGDTIDAITKRVDKQFDIISRGVDAGSSSLVAIGWATAFLILTLIFALVLILSKEITVAVPFAICLVLMALLQWLTMARLDSYSSSLDIKLLDAKVIEIFNGCVSTYG